MKRRSLLARMSSAAMLAPFLGLHAAMAQQDGLRAEPHDDLAALPEMQMMGNEKIAMILFPGFTALDLVGPHYFFACMMGAEVDLITTAETLDPVASDLALAIAPDKRLAEARERYDLVFVPGGTEGVLAAMRDDALLAFLRKSAQTARYITSVCTGSAVLGQAGLLRGRKATSHWAIVDELGRFGATPVSQRVVRDGNIVTGAGVSAGLDLALEIVGDLRGAGYSRALTLQAEYAPRPPYADGSIEAANPAISGVMQEMFAPFSEQVKALAAPMPAPGKA